MLSIVLPCYNPSEDWVENIISRIESLSKGISDIELVLVNDGSTGNVDRESFQRLSSAIPKAKFIQHSVNRGKGYSLREGVRVAAGQFVIYTDVDFPYTEEGLMKIYTTLTKEDADIAMGIRGEEYYSHLPKTRVLISRLLKYFIKTFLQLPVADTQCGLKGMNKTGKEIFLQTTIDRYLFDLEFIFLAAGKKLRIRTVDVQLRPEVQLSKMNWKILLHEMGNFLKIFVRTIKN